MEQNEKQPKNQETQEINEPETQIEDLSVEGAPDAQAAQIKGGPSMAEYAILLAHKR
jgi:hypothetical protein